MRVRSRPGALPGDDTPPPARLFVQVRRTRGRRSAAWSSAGRRDWRRPVFAGVVVAAVAGAAFVLSRPPEPGLSDPKAILDAAMAELSTAQSVHVVADLDGTVSLGLFSPAGDGSAQPLTLTGTHAEGDIDLAAHEASLRFEVPALLGLTGRLVELEDGTYITSSLTGDGWSATGDGIGPALPIGEPLAQLARLRTVLRDLAGSATRLDDADCASGRCYQVRLSLTGEQARALVPAPSARVESDGPGGSISSSPGRDAAGATIVAQVDRATLRLTGALVHLELGDGSSLNVDVRFSAWDAPVAIEPPPSEVAPSASPAPAL